MRLRLPFTPMGSQVAALADCTCDPRFIDVAHDIDCPIHGVKAVTETDADGLLAGQCGNAARDGIDGSRRRQHIQADAA